MLSFLYGPTLTFVHDYWKNRSFDYMDICWQNNVEVIMKIIDEGTVASWKESYDKPRLCIKKQRHHFANKGTYIQNYGFSSSHVQM